MFNDLKLDKEFKPLETLTVLSVVLMAYSFLYQHFFFHAIGVGWATNLLSVNLILLTSIKILIVSSISIAIGYGLAAKYYLSNNINLLTLMFVVLCILNGILGKYFVELSSFANGATSVVFACLYTVSTSYFFFILFKLIFRIQLAKRQGNAYRPAYIFTVGLIPFLFLFVPWNIAQLEAIKVSAAPDNFYNMVTIDGDDSKWFLISVGGEKALIRKASDNKVFKYIDMKDIGEIYAQK